MILAAGVVAAAVAQAGTIDPAVQAQIRQSVAIAPRPVAVVIELEGKPDLAALARKVASLPQPQRPGALAAELRAAFEARAKAVRPVLASAGAMQVESLWLAHAFAALLPPKSVEKVAAAPGVVRVASDPQLKAPVRSAGGGARARARRAAPPPVQPAPPFDPVAWRGELPLHLAALGVAAEWQRGVTGAGVTVAIVDSGVDSRERPVMASFRGGASDWFDPYDQHREPFDGGGHGTHVAYVIAGGPAVAGGPPVGVAPRARWIAARIYDDAGLGRASAVHRIYQWVLDPDGRPDTPDAPQIVNNSWGLPQTIGRCDLQFARDIAALRAAGIHMVFAAGNEGPDPNTSISPANNPGALAVGALDRDGRVADQSGRGPSACGGGTYPHVHAPGVQIESADAAGRIVGEPLRVTGTSFAAALASGMLALLASEDPKASVESREQALAARLSGEMAAASKSPTALAWRPALGAEGTLDIDAQTLARVLPWTAKLARVEIETPPAQGQLQTLSAERLRLTAAQPAPFVLLAHTRDGRLWRIAVEPQPPVAAPAVAMRRLSLAAREGETLLLSRAQCNFAGSLGQFCN